MENSFNELLDSLPDEVYWGVMEEIEKRPLVITDQEFRKDLEELDQIVNDCLMEDASVSKITEDDEW